jgi:hypothetical protein
MIPSSRTNPRAWQTGSGLLLPTAPARDSAGVEESDERSPLQIRLWALGSATLFITELVVVRGHFEGKARGSLDHLIFAVGVAAVITLLSALRWFRWLNTPVQRKIDAGFGLSRWTFIAGFQLFLTATWLLRDLPPLPWLLGGAVILIAAEIVVRSLWHVLHASRRGRRAA